MANGTQSDNPHSALSCGRRPWCNSRREPPPASNGDENIDVWEKYVPYTARNAALPSGVP